jgi:tripartite-type tricarboxylate transporter receptor subunit TctC
MNGAAGRKTIMGMMTRLGAAALVSAMALCAFERPAMAETVADFYRGKTISIMIGVPAGGGYDIYARLLGRHMSKHIPGEPLIIAQNMPGGGELAAMNHVVNVAPQNGTFIGAVVRTAPFQPLYGNQAAKFDPKTVNWIGSSNQDVGVVIAWNTAAVKSASDLLTKELVVGANPPGSDTATYANVIKYLFGANLKIVGGYPGSEDIALAMQQGEVEAIPNYSWSSVQRHPDWLAEKKVTILLQNGLKKLPDLPDVPLLGELARSDDERAILNLILEQTNFGRPYFVGPGVPPDRVAALRAAFTATMVDADFLADAKKSKLEIDPLSGEEMQTLLARVYDTPQDVVDKANAIRLR